MAENDDQWLWVADDDDLQESAFQFEPLTPEVKTAPVTDPAVLDAIRLHLAGKSSDAVRKLESASKGDSAAAALAALGQVCAESGQWEAAAGAFRRLSAADPKHKYAAYNHGLCLEKLGQYEKAATQFELALEGCENAARLGLGICRLRQDQIEPALDHFGRVLSQNATDRVAMLGEALCLQRLGRPEAESAYTALLKHHPDTLAAWHNLMLLYARRQQWDKAADAAAQVLKREANSVAALEVLATAALASGKTSDSLRYCASLIQRSPSSFAAQYNYGLSLAQAGRLDEAVQAYSEATRIRPDSAHAWLNLGVILQQKGSVDAARQAYDHALRNDPNLQSALWNQALAAEQAGQFEDAAILYAEVAERQPSRPEVYFRMGYAQLLANDAGASADSFQECARLDPASIDARLNLALATWRAGRVDDARSALAAIEQKKPDSIEVLRALAGLTLESKDLDAARKYQERLQAVGDSHPALAYNLGVAFADAGRHEEAIAAYTQAVDQDSDFAAGWLNLGHSFHKLGLQEQAQTAWKHYQTLS